jgi:chemotaxis protein MotB
VDKQQVGKLALAIQVAFRELGVFPGAAAPSTPPGRENIEQLTAAPAQSSPGAAAVEQGPEDLSALRRELEASLQPEITRRVVDIRAIPDGLVISLREIGFFASGSAAIEPRSQSTFARIAGLLSERAYRIRIEGHTDNVPIHNSQFKSNWELSTARATELVRVLITQYQFVPARLSAAGFAEYHPVAGNDTAEGRAENRRVDLVVLGKWAAAPAEDSFVKPSPSTPLPPGGNAPASPQN